MCLFSVLNQLKEEMDFSLYAVHVNHGFRPGDAEDDQQFAEQLCSRNGVKCYSFKFDCNAIAKEDGLSSEEAGRKVRYASFLEVAGELALSGIPKEKIKIAVAQNADDQAETVLFRLLRGTGTDGLAGMAYSRAEGEFSVIRPLLDTWRKDIEAYCAENGLTACTDKTNLQPIYTRNKIRLQLIPYLQENFNENIMEALGRLSRIAGEDKDFLWQCAEEAYDALLIRPEAVLDQKGLAELPAAVRHRVVMKALKVQGMEQDITATHLEAVDSILNATGESKTVEFPGGYRMSVRYGEAAFYSVGTSRRAGSSPQDRAYVSQNSEICADHDVLRAKTAKTATCEATPVRKTTSFDKNRHAESALAHQTTAGHDQHAPGASGTRTAAFDADKVAAVHGDAQPVFRTRRPGDYIAIPGGRKKIQNLFVDMKIPKENRDSIQLAAVGSEVLWLPEQPEYGVKKPRYNSAYKLDANTKNVLSLEMFCEI